MTDIVEQVEAGLREAGEHPCRDRTPFGAQLREAADTIATLQTKLDKAVEGLGRQAEGWSNALEMDIISERHRTSAKLLADEAQSLIKELQP